MKEQPQPVPDPLARSYCFGRFTLDLLRGSLCSGEDEVKLRPKSFDLLRYLVENTGRLVAKEELIAAVWPDVAVTDDSLVLCIKEVRRALGDDSQEFIKTVPRRGYLFAPEVTRATSQSRADDRVAPIRLAPVPPVKGKATVGRRTYRLGRVGKWAAATVIPIALLGAGVLLLRPRQAAGPTGLEYTQVTNFADSVVAPALSPDGRMLAFIRGENTFQGPGEIYAKLLPDGEPVQLTHDGSLKIGPASFSPDGSRIAYSTTEDTWTVPVLGGEPSRMLANATGLTWIEGAAGRPRILFSELTGQGMHMGIFTSTESRTEERKVYLPSDVRGMAHRSFLSPDHKWVLVVEMDVSGWLPCRVVPFDASSTGRRVGPEPYQCTDGAWSPDGKWMYLSANTGNGFHIWRQRFPNGAPEQVTFGGTEEQGIAFAGDGRSFLTSVGEGESTIWVHDSRGERQITSQGYAYLPSFSADGQRLYYLQRSHANRRFVSGELWVTNLETGKRERLLPDFLMEHYNVSRDGNHVVFVMADDARHSPVWIATLDGSSPPRRLSPFDAVRAVFGANGDVFFAGGEAGSVFLYRIKQDGSGLQKVVATPATFLYDVSGDGKWLAAWVGSSVAVYPAGGGSPTLICSNCATAGEENRGVTPPLVSWSPDQKFFYLHLAEPSRQTFAVPLQPGQMVPPLPTLGIRSPADVMALPGARLIPQQRAFAGAAPSIYAFPRVTTHRNIYRIPVPVSRR